MAQEIREKEVKMSTSPLVRSAALAAPSLIEQAHYKLGNSRVEGDQTLDFSFPKGPLRHPRHTVMLASLGFTSSTTAEAMDDVIRRNRRRWFIINHQFACRGKRWNLYCFLYLLFLLFFDLLPIKIESKGYLRSL